jgi:multidrug transporter EmrE-like cation transporter
MSRRGLILVLMAGLTTVAANLLMRGSVLRSGGVRLSAATLVPQLIRVGSQPLFLLGAALYALSAVIWFSVISTEQLNLAYPILVSVTFILVTAGSRVFYAESISVAKVCGLLLMLLGIWIVAKK